MKINNFLLVIIIALIAATYANIFATLSPEDGDYRNIYPKFCLSIKAQKNYILPYSLGLIENLRYPKDRMHILLIVNNQNYDNEVVTMAEEWSEKMAKLYLSTTVVEESDNFMETALQWGRKKSCENLLITTDDYFLLPNIIKELMDLQFIAVSPLMNGPFGMHSNVHGLLDLFFVQRKKIGSQQVYYINTPMFINLKKMDASYLTFDSENLREYDEIDSNPIKIFAYSAFTMKIPLFVDNKKFYGYILDSNYYSTTVHRQLLGYFLATVVSESGPTILPYSSVLKSRDPPLNKFGFDKIYIINLKHQSERLNKMKLILKLLGIDYEIFEAVDGNSLSMDALSKIMLLPEFDIPFTKNPMTKREMECFLSHYKIWNDVIKNNYETVIIFEDDVRFAVNSTQQLTEVTEDIIKTELEWDIIFLGQKTSFADGILVPDHRYLSSISTSFWEHGYILSNPGARKLISAKSLEQLLPLHEFLEIMCNNQSSNQWSNDYPSKSLSCFAVYPSIVTPEGYSNEKRFIGDIEASTVIMSFQENVSHSPSTREKSDNQQSSLRATTVLAKIEL